MKNPKITSIALMGSLVFHLIILSWGKGYGTPESVQMERVEIKFVALQGILPEKRSAAPDEMKSRNLRDMHQQTGPIVAEDTSNDAVTALAVIENNDLPKGKPILSPEQDPGETSTKSHLEVSQDKKAGSLNDVTLESKVSAQNVGVEKKKSQTSKAKTQEPGNKQQREKVMQKNLTPQSPVQETAVLDFPRKPPDPETEIRPREGKGEMASSAAVASIPQRSGQGVVTSDSARRLPGQEAMVPHEVKAPANGGKPYARLADYLAAVRGMVENNREYPAMARQLGLQGTVTVRVAILADGSIGEVTVATSSGHKSLDKAAVTAVRRSAPFKPPGGFNLGEVTMEIPIVYRLT